MTLVVGLAISSGISHSHFIFTLNNPLLFLQPHFNHTVRVVNVCVGFTYFPICFKLCIIKVRYFDHNHIIYSEAYIQMR